MVSKSKSEFEDWLFFQIKAIDLPLPEREHRFHPTRRWRFDLAWPDRLLAAEVEGGVYSQGRHTRGSGYVKDCEKYSEAAILGWRVLRFPTQTIPSGEAVAMIERALAAVGAI